MSKFQDIDGLLWEYINGKRNEGYPVSREVITTKALEVAKELEIPYTKFKASLGWCKRMMLCSGLCLRCRTTLALCLPADYAQKLIAYQPYIIKLRKAHNYLLSQMANDDQTPVFF